MGRILYVNLGLLALTALPIYGLYKYKKNKAIEEIIKKCPVQYNLWNSCLVRASHTKLCDEEYKELAICLKQVAEA